jgi:hypothetical protein
MSAVPLMYFPALMMFPCNPPFTGSWLPACYADANNVPETVMIKIPTRIVIIALGTVDTIVYCNVLQDTLLHGVYIVGISVTCFFEYLLIVGNAVSQGFRSIGKPMDNFYHYNGIVLLNKLVISRCGKVMFPSTFCGPWIMQVLCLYGTIHAAKGIRTNPFLFILFLSIYIDMVIASVVLSSVGSKIHTTSVSMREEWAREARKRNDKYGERKAKALLPVNVKLGGNFIDRHTPILIQDFCVNQTLSLLLLEN